MGDKSTLGLSLHITFEKKFLYSMTSPDTGIRPLTIGDLKISPPIIQGGMGVRVSRANLAAAVANEGCAGVIATAGSGQFEEHPGTEFTEVNEKIGRASCRERV